MATLGNGARTIGTGITKGLQVMAEPGYFLFGESLAGKIGASCVEAGGDPFPWIVAPHIEAGRGKTGRTTTLASVWLCQGVAAAQAERKLTPL